MRAILAVALVTALGVALAAVVGSQGADEVQAKPWTYARSMSQRRSYVAAAEVSGQIYAVGGMVGETGRFLSTAQLFDPRANSWSGLPRLPEAVRAGAGAALGDRVYVIGGQAEESDGSQVYAFDIASASWTQVAPLPESRFNMAAVALGGRIYAMGGYSETEERADVFVYDPGSDSWNEGTPLPRPNHTFGAVVFHGEIWTIGGRRGEDVLHDVWIYDPAADRWREGPRMPQPMELVGAAVAGDEIHAVWEGTYQIYDARTDSWRSGPRPLVTRHGLKAFAIHGMLYTVGGCTTDLHDSQVVERRSLT
jgi:N-acetylneuraminic acid mutarotase